MKVTAADEGPAADHLGCYEGTTRYTVLTICERNKPLHIRIRLGFMGTKIQNHLYELGVVASSILVRLHGCSTNV